MQKQKLDTSYFLAIQATYTGIDWALCQNDSVLDTLSINKFEASRMLLCALEELLRRHTILLEHMSFIAVNQGPGPFTTLRTVLATVNGLAYASGIPLVGVNGITTLALATQTSANTHIVALLNAFNHDVYYALAYNGTLQEFGCQNGIVLLEHLRVQSSLNTPFLFIGNGVETLQTDITRILGPQAQLANPYVSTASIEQIAHAGLQLWQNQSQTTAPLMPVYLKAYAAPLRKS